MGFWQFATGGGSGGGTGDVVGPASSTDNAVARFDLATGKLIQNSALIVADTTGDISWNSDTGLARSAAGVVKVTDGGAGAGSLEITDAAAISAAGVRGSTKTTYGLSIGSSGGTDFSSLVANATPILGVSSTHVFLHTLVPLLWTHGGIGSGGALGLYPTTGYGDNRDLLTVAYGSTPRAILSAVRLEANTAGSGTPNAIAATESGTVFTNEGVTAKNYHTLPSAVAGYKFTFIVQDADGMRIVANTDDTIRVIDKVTAAAGYIESATIGSTVTLVSINAVEWYATSINGVWTDGTFTYDDTSLTTP